MYVCVYVLHLCTGTPVSFQSEPSRYTISIYSLFVCLSFYFCLLWISFISTHTKYRIATVRRHFALVYKPTKNKFKETNNLNSCSPFSSFYALWLYKILFWQTRIFIIHVLHFAVVRLHCKYLPFTWYNWAKKNSSFSSTYTYTIFVLYSFPSRIFATFSFSFIHRFFFLQLTETVYLKIFQDCFWRLNCDHETAIRVFSSSASFSHNESNHIGNFTLCCCCLHNFKNNKSYHTFIQNKKNFATFAITWWIWRTFSYSLLLNSLPHVQIPMNLIFPKFKWGKNWASTETKTIWQLEHASIEKQKEMRKINVSWRRLLTPIKTSTMTYN